jgi:hypothetical protein
MVVGCKLLLLLLLLGRDGGGGGGDGDGRIGSVTAALARRSRRKERRNGLPRRKQSRTAVGRSTFGDLKRGGEESGRKEGRKERGGKEKMVIHQRDSSDLQE